MIFALFLAMCCFLASPLAQAADTLSANQTLRDGQTLVSSGQVFEFGFLSPNKSSARYLGIWYKNIPLQVTWVANRNNPITDSSAELALSSQGSVSLRNGLMNYWSVIPAGAVDEPFLRLLDNGNLVLSDASASDSSGDYLWQSFDNITNTLLPEMKLGWNLRTGLKQNMTSWASEADPSSGQYTFSLEPPDAPQLILWEGSQKQFRWGPWNGERFSGSNEFKANAVFDPMFISSPEEVYYTYTVVDNSTLSRFIVTPEGAIQYLAWLDNQWTNLVTLQRDYCDNYGECGPYGTCYDSTVGNCRCLKGFRRNDSNPLDWTGGCSRTWNLSCGNGECFVKYKGLKLPDNSRLLGNRSSNLEECLKNCSCMAFTRVDVHGNGGDCLLWFGDLVDMKNYPSGGDVIHIRMAKAEIDAIARAKRRRRIAIAVGISVSTVCGMLILAFIGRYALQRRKERRRATYSVYRDSGDGGPEEDLELPLLDIVAVADATNNFSFQNKVGQGHIAHRARCCCEEALTELWAGPERVQERGYTDCQTSTPESCEAPRMLHSWRRKNVNLRVLAEPKLGPPPFRFGLFKTALNFKIQSLFNSARTPTDKGMENMDRGECTWTSRCPDGGRISLEGSAEVHPAATRRPANNVIGRAYVRQRDF
ncbi:hypothetical protein EUGRSUZ_D01374 [Eucalyptus grandis]|uniref:Uncharacterized protein n=2 Tax=Eucalyptus grandis TaxID=71139 RepID=A0ACC3L4X4_EUCGR|nr:hypothetical protein EUGRSUZ_D01374 [Eucalyptus grandis]